MVQHVTLRLLNSCFMHCAIKSGRRRISIMMWLVRLALRRPISVAVMALLMLVLGTLSFFLMNIDIFQAIDVPVVMVPWNYPGMASLDMERRTVFISERAYSTTVNGIEHIESESMLGVGLLKVYFQPGADIASAIAQINAVSETILSNMARGTEPPQIISYNAADVPVAQLSDTKSVSQRSCSTMHSTLCGCSSSRSRANRHNAAVL